MKAAVVSSFDASPRYEEFPLPVPDGNHDMVVDVLAAGLHPRVRSQAGGSHYTSTGDLPLVPGIDGVGRGPDGLLRYFVLPDTTLGSMAEQALIDTRRSVLLPEDSDPVAVAAAMNPAMSSWVALRRRIQFPGRAGRPCSRRHRQRWPDGGGGREAASAHSQIIAAGRNADRLAALSALGATATVQLGGDGRHRRRLGHAAADVDVVIDYLWGGRQPPQWRPSSPAGPTRQAAHLDRDRLGGRSGRGYPVGRPARRPVADRGQRAGLGQLPRDRGRVARTGGGRSPAAPSTSTRGPCRWPMSSRPGPTPPAPASASCSSREPR